MTWHVQKLTDAGKLSLLQEMYREWPFMQVLLYITYICIQCSSEWLCDQRHAKHL